jgi:DNA-directed RNA polymerase subunit L
LKKEIIIIHHKPLLDKSRYVYYNSYNYQHKMGEKIMKTIQMTLDEDLVETVDKIVKKLNTTRSAFTRKALREAINRLNVKKLEEKHKRGYDIHPVNKNEFSVWEKEQDWDDE